MSSLAIADFRTRVLDMLDDVTSERFTDRQIDAALRSALIYYDKIRPLKRTYQIDTTGEKVLTLPADFEAIMLTRCQLYNPATSQAYFDLGFEARYVDEQWEIETTAGAYAVGQVIKISYGARQTIDGLDGAAGTTIDEPDLLVLGGAALATHSRAVSRSETINMQPAVQAQLMNLSQDYMSMFLTGLKRFDQTIAQAFE